MSRDTVNRVVRWLVILLVPALVLAWYRPVIPWEGAAANCRLTYAIVSDLVETRHGYWNRVLFDAAVDDAFTVWEHAFASRGLDVAVSPVPAPPVSTLTWTREGSSTYPRSPAGIDVLVTATSDKPGDVTSVPGLRHDPGLGFEQPDGGFGYRGVTHDTDGRISLVVPSELYLSRVPVDGAQVLVPFAPWDSMYDQFMLIHEVGHAFGLDHSTNPDSVMAPGDALGPTGTITSADLDELEQRFAHCRVDPTAPILTDRDPQAVHYLPRTVRDQAGTTCVLTAGTVMASGRVITTIAGVSPGPCARDGVGTSMYPPGVVPHVLSVTMTGPPEPAN